MTASMTPSWSTRCRFTLKCNGNLKRLAEELGVHYNTVAYRIQRIKELAGVSFDNSDQLLNLQIALKIHEIHKTR